MAGGADDQENPDNNQNPPNPPIQTPQAPHSVSTVKLPTLKKGDNYDIWAMKMEHYITHTDYPLWQIILNGNSPKKISTDTNGIIRVLPPKSAEDFLAIERERKARTTLLMALPEDHLYGFHNISDAKEMWDAIKSRFGGNAESKKMQKYILKQEFESFSVSNSEGLHKGYDRFTSVLYHGTKTGLDTLSFDDLYNNLRVFESDVKGSGGSSSSAHNVAFVGSECTTSTNKQAEPKALAAVDGESIDWNDHAEDDADDCAFTAQVEENFDDFALMAFTSDNGSSTAWSFYQKNQLIYEEKIGYMKVDLDDKTNVLEYHKKLLAEAIKEKEDLKSKLEHFQNSSKGLAKLLNSQLSAKDKSGLGFDGQITESDLFNFDMNDSSVFDNRSSDLDGIPLYNRFKKAEGNHAVPPPLIGIYMPPRSVFGLDESNFSYGPKQSNTSESEPKTSKFDSCESNSSVESLESMPKPVVSEPKVLIEPRVWSDAPIIEEYESDSDDDYEIRPSKEQVTPSYAFVNTAKHVKTPREPVNVNSTYSQSPKVDKRDWNGRMSKTLGLGYSFTKKACFVCGSLGHLIRDCTFHEEKIAKQIKLNKMKGKGTGPREERPVWNNVQRTNHQNKFVPQSVLTKSGRFPINTGRHNFTSQPASIRSVRKVNTGRPKVNETRPKSYFYKSHSPFRRPFNNTTALKTTFTKQKVNTAGVNSVSAVGENRETAVKASAGCNWRSKRHYWNKFSKYNGGSMENPPSDLEDEGIVDSGCSRHMTGNKEHLDEYQDIKGGLVTFGGSKGRITGKGKIRTGKLDFENVYFVKELGHFNLFSVSQICDKRNRVLFTESECLVLSPDFKMPDESQVLLKIPRKQNMYSFNLGNLAPKRDLACLVAKATINESNKWHRRTFLNSAGLRESEGEEPENQGRKIQDIDDDPLVSLARASMNESAADFITPSKLSASGEAQEKDISPTTMEAARTLLQVASEGVSTYKRRRRSSDTGSDVNTNLDFFSTAKERIKTTELNIGSSPGKSGGAEISTDKGQNDGKKKKSSEELKKNIQFKRLMRSIERIMPMRSEERIKRLGIELEQESSKKHKTVGSKEVLVIQENVEEPVIIKDEEIAKPVKKTRKRHKTVARKKRFSQAIAKGDDEDSKYEKEKEQLSLYLIIASDEDKEVDYEILDQKSPIIEWKSKYYGLNQCLMKLKEDLCALYQLVMDRYQDEIIIFDSYTLGRFDNNTDSDMIIYMLVEKKYPLMKKILLHMLKGLSVAGKCALWFGNLEARNGDEKGCLSVGLSLHNKWSSFTKNCMVINSPCFYNKELATPEQTATGKEISNPLIADSLLKTIGSSMHLVTAMKH
ncbi:ribonuclease H-like domain-containing protein [Tanacetum coccineum]